MHWINCKNSLDKGKKQMGRNLRDLGWWELLTLGFRELADLGLVRCGSGWSWATRCDRSAGRLDEAGARSFSSETTAGGGAMQGTWRGGAA